MARKIIMNEVTSDEFVRLLDYTVNRVTTNEDLTTVEFIKEIDGALIGREIMIDDDGMHMSQEYLVDVLPESETE